MAKKGSMAGGIFAIVVFVLGGILTFTGLGLIAFMKGQDLFGLGEGRSFGILLFTVGLVASILGVLVMRVVRNRY